MPTANVYYTKLDQKNAVERVTSDLKTFIAKELTCGDISLGSHEVSVRPIKVDGDGMIGDVEVEVKAHAFQDRVENQDGFCLDLERFLEKRTEISNIKVWLILSELGNSMW